MPQRVFPPSRADCLFGQQLERQRALQGELGAGERITRGSSLFLSFLAVSPPLAVALSPAPPLPSRHPLYFAARPHGGLINPSSQQRPIPVLSSPYSRSSRPHCMTPRKPERKRTCYGSHLGATLTDVACVAHSNIHALSDIVSCLAWLMSLPQGEN